MNKKNANTPSDLAAISKQLASSALFAGVDLGSLENILMDLPLLRLSPAEELIRIGVSEDCMYLVLEGELGVHVEETAEEPLAVMGPGDSVGELSVLDKRPRSAAVRARTDAVVLKVESEEFWRLTEVSHQVALNMLHVLTDRLRGNNSTIADMRRLREMYRRNASTDALTNLYNRRGLTEMGTRLIRRLAIMEAPLSLMMVDVDHFKKFNDEHGHQAGDFVLFVVANVLKVGVRPTDFVARYGGEEFTILLPETPVDGALVAAERVRNAIRQAELEMPDGRVLPPVTASFGVAQMREGQSLDELIAEADVALYQAKREGRDRVVASSGPTSSSSAIAEAL